MFIVFYPFYISLDCVCFISHEIFLFTNHNQYFIFFIILQMNTFSYAPIYLKSTINFLHFLVRMNVNCFAVDFIMTTILDFVSVFQPSFFRHCFRVYVPHIYPSSAHVKFNFYMQNRCVCVRAYVRVYVCVLYTVQITTNFMLTWNVNRICVIV